ncbi:hypothetical protein ACEQ6A_08830 [Rhizobium brockwellii]|uniref:hypothetical protein n=1 Tax=Rhizobium brockwellii TaxID=3019932 RepID=UPI003F9564FE
MKEHDPRAILAAFAEAVADLLQDTDLARAKPEEISITTDLAMKMGPYFPEWRVSPEWTRREDEEKRLAWDDEEGKRRLKKIRPDIIVHHMHRQDENLLVVEAKRVQNTDFEDDIRKLTLMTLEASVDPSYHYGYAVGLHLVIDLPARAVTRADVYRDGAIDGALTSEFRRHLDTIIQNRAAA